MDSERDILDEHLALANMRRLMSVAGLYLVACELVKSTVIDGVRDFFGVGWDREHGFKIGEKYTTHVLAGHQYELDACLRWLVQASALSEEEAATAHRLRDERNRVAHEITAVLTDPGYELDLPALVDARIVLKRLATFFGGIAVDTDPAFDREVVDYEEIESGVSLLYAHLLEAFLDEHTKHSDTSL